MNRDEREGKAKDLKGRAKETAGDVTGSDRLQDEGAAEQAEGKTQQTWGEGKRRAGETIEDLGDKIKE